MGWGKVGGVEGGMWGQIGVKGGGGANFRFRIVVRQRWRLCKIRGECREQIM